MLIADVQITAYSTDRILSEKTDAQSDRLIFYNEPTPESVGPLLDYIGDTPVQKMLVCLLSLHLNEPHGLTQGLQWAGEPVPPRVMLCV